MPFNQYDRLQCIILTEGGHKTVVDGDISSVVDDITDARLSQSQFYYFERDGKSNMSAIDPFSIVSVHKKESSAW